MAEGGVPARRRWRPRLADTPVGAKLGVVLVVPLLGVIAFAGFGASYAAAESGRAGADRAAVQAAVGAAELADAVQRERLAAARLFGDGSDVSRAAYAVQAAATDLAIERFRTARLRVSGDDAAAASLRRVDTTLAGLPALRTTAVAREPNVPASSLLFEYRSLLADLVAVQLALSERSMAPRVTAAVRALGQVGAAKEELASAQVLALRVLAEGRLAPAAQRDLVASWGAYQQRLRGLDARGTDWRASLDRVLAGPDAAAAETVIAQLSATAPDGEAAIDGGSARWVELSLAQLDRMRELEQSVNTAAVDAAAAAARAHNRAVIIGVGALLLVLAISVALAAVVARSMARALRTVRAAALRVAFERLPQTMSLLRAPESVPLLSVRPDPADARLVTPQRLGEAAGDAVPVPGRDEVGQVAEAFNAVHRTAVEAATEQAALRAGVATMIVELARRNTRLVESLIKELDGAERDEPDPDRLDVLFRLDHLATRLRHTNEGLLVLAGSDAGRTRDEPIRLADVLRAAQSQIEHYRRIEYGRVEPDVAIAAPAVDDLVHLVAELLDNATRFSIQQVFVEGRRTGSGAVIHIADRGVGLTQHRLTELNQRLADPPELDVTDSRAMGLAVAARLARRHDIRVRLQRPFGDGVVAVVRLPDGIVRAAAPAVPPPTVAQPVLPRPLERGAVLPGGEAPEVPPERRDLVVPTPRAAAGRRGPAAGDRTANGDRRDVVRAHAEVPPRQATRPVDQREPVTAVLPRLGSNGLAVGEADGPATSTRSAAPGGPPGGSPAPNDTANGGALSDGPPAPQRRGSDSPATADAPGTPGKSGAKASGVGKSAPSPGPAGPGRGAGPGAPPAGGGNDAPAGMPAPPVPVPKREPGRSLPAGISRVPATASGAPATVEPDEARSLLASYQHGLGRFGAAPVPASDPPDATDQPSPGAG